MSASMGGVAASSNHLVRAPDKGAFPLDHFNECKGQMEAYLACMKENGQQHAKCREQTAQYLKCRMAQCCPPLPSPCLVLCR